MTNNEMRTIGVTINLPVDAWVEFSRRLNQAPDTPDWIILREMARDGFI